MVLQNAFNRLFQAYESLVIQNKQWGHVGWETPWFGIKEAYKGQISSTVKR